MAINNRRPLFIGIMLLLVATASILAGIRIWISQSTDGHQTAQPNQPIDGSSPPEPGEPPDGPDTLEPVEIREYQGQKLSSINDFRENSIKGPQFVDNESYRLTVTGLVNSEIALTYDTVVTGYQHYEKVVTLYCIEGWDVTILWEGILLKDLLDEAGIKPTATVVIFYAYDGYSTSLPLDYIINNNILMAHKMNGLVLPPERGFPFHLVAESKFGYKWIKWITAIELSDNEDYRGYWESRGFSNDADIP